MFYSIFPPVIAIIGAMLTKRIIPSLLLGLLTGTFLKTKTVLGTIYSAGTYLADIVGNKENAYIILFLFSFGALAEMFKLGGGISGFARRVEKHVKKERDVFLTVWFASLISFMDCCFHVISTGTIALPLLEKVKGTKERLALIINTTSSQLIVLIPFATTYLGYILGILSSSMRRYGVSGNPYNLYLKSIFLNFYSVTMLLISIILIFKSIDIFGLHGSKWIKKTKDVSEHSAHEGHEESEFAAEVPPRLFNLLLPIIMLLTLIIYLFWWTGRNEGTTFWEKFLNADFENAIFVATLGTIIFTAILYSLQKIPMRSIEKSLINGGVELLPPIIILVLAWSIAEVTSDLGFNAFISTLIKTNFPDQLVPIMIFLIGVIASYFMGSSWGTWALMMPLAFSLAVGTGANLPLTVGAVLAGGSVGDNISPLGETPVLTASVLKLSISEHINYILPFGVVSIIVSAALYLALGYAL